MVESARALDAFLRAKRDYAVKQYRERYGIDKRNLKFDVVAHSMGGLVLRYYLRYGTAEPPPPGTPPTWAGAELVERAVLVGTPNAGSDRVTFVFSDHLGMIRDPVFTDNLLFLLLEEPRAAGEAASR